MTDSAEEIKTEGKAAAGELKLSDRFHRAKRNLFWSSSLLIVVAISSPKHLEIPGLGKSELSLSAALILLFVGVSYAFVEYWTEYQVASIKNSEAVRDSTSEEIVALFARQTSVISELISNADTVASAYRSMRDNSETQLAAALQREDEERILVAQLFDSVGLGSHLQHQIEMTVLTTVPEKIDALSQERLRGIRSTIYSLKPENDGLDRSIDDLIGGLKAELPDLVNAALKDPLYNTLMERVQLIQSEVAERHRLPLPEWVSDVDTLEKKGASIIQQVEGLERWLLQYDVTQQKLARDFRNLSSSLHLAQKVSFTWLDTWAPRAIAAASVCALFWVLFFGEVGWLVYHPEPLQNQTVHSANSV